MSVPIPRSFFSQDPVTCARALIGCKLVWEGCAGIVAETEAYAALGDEAAHTWNRPSARAFLEKHSPGAAYVYFNYGMYWMLNVLIKGGASDGFVLFRALEPMEGMEKMRKRQSVKRKAGAGPIADTALCSGPGKMAQALAVTGKDHGRDFCGDRRAGLYFPESAVEVETCVRIGISRAQDFPWRFLLAKSAHVSVRAKLAK